MRRLPRVVRTPLLLAAWLGGLFGARQASAGPAASARGGVVPLPAAHAHNDYEHPRPLLDALDHGFCSVEADIFLVDGQLLVGHTRAQLHPDRTLESLYLEPLRQRIALHGGRVYTNGPALTLLIDFKTPAGPTYAALRETLARYAGILTSVEGGAVTPRAVTAILSGSAPRAELSADSPRYAALDGRATDLDSPLPPHLLPLISENWRKLFAWTGQGALPDDQRAKLRDYVATAHRAGRRVRFWNAPSTPAAWKELLAAGVDLLSVDDLAAAREFLLQAEVTR